MKTIWKFPLEVRDRQTIAMPAGGRVLSVQVQQDQLCLWALVDPAERVENRTVRIVGTGNPFEGTEDGLDYVGTVQVPPFVWHVFVLRRYS